MLTKVFAFAIIIVLHVYAVKVDDSKNNKNNGNVEERNIESDLVDLVNPLAKYEYKYEVVDPQTGDRKSQFESRDGDVVRGEYTIVDADGTIRTVKYTADKKNGFNAVITKNNRTDQPTTTTSTPVVEAQNTHLSFRTEPYVQYPIIKQHPSKFRYNKFFH